MLDLTEAEVSYCVYIRAPNFCYWLRPPFWLFTVAGAEMPEGKRAGCGTPITRMVEVQGRKKVGGR